MLEDIVKREKALFNFFSSFGLPVYDETSVPDEAKMPYMTCEIKTGHFDYPVPIAISLYYYSDTWTEITKKAREIITKVGESKAVRYDGGGFNITIEGQQYERMGDPASDMIRRIHITVMCEFVN